ncbi:MAG: ABC transporter permease [Solirubrobacterales bacterium 70-9]|nr:MAG: ABC transporter permease [Solirubrobacterales bacterium 70-9]
MAVAEPTALGQEPVLAGNRRLLLSALGPMEWTGLGLVVLITLVAIFTPLIAPHDPYESIGAPYQSVGHGGLLGTDDIGRDLFSRLLYGMRTSWFSALAVVGVGAIFGSIVGLVAGIRGGWVDTVLMRATDAGLALPGPIIAIAVAVALGPSLINTLIAVTLVWWPWYARIVRGETRAIVVRPHFDAARLAGARRVGLAIRHVLPGVLPTVVIAASVDLGFLVLTLAGLSFLGLGAPAPAPELGSMAYQGLDALFSFPLIPLAPAVAVFVLAAAANMAGDGLRDLLDDV